MGRKLLYVGIWATTVALSFVGAVACVITEGCSIACDFLDKALEKLERQASL